MSNKFDKDLLPVVTQIRHEFTNYDKLVAFYNYYKKERRVLNGVIYALIKGDIDIPTFRQRVADIENSIDLTKKKNQKRFLKEEVERLDKKSLQKMSVNTLKQFAKSNLSKVLHGKNIKPKITKGMF